MNFEQYLNLSAKEINNELNSILNDFLKKTKKTNHKLVPFAKKFKEANIGGKRIRGTLCKLGFELTQSVILSETKDLSRMREANDIIRVASALEILHTALLIHDDIMDKSPTRRGRASLHKALGGDHQAMSQAVSLGDIALYLPIQIISNSSFTNERKIKVLSFLSEVIINTGWGQILDVQVDKQKSEVEFIRIYKQSLQADNKNYIFIATYKTAKYTIAGPMQIGAMLAGGSDKLVNKLGEFGEYLGIAFQIKDDILDGSVRKLDSQQSLAIKYISKAKEIIPTITKNPKMRKILEEMGDYLVHRTI